MSIKILCRVMGLFSVLLTAGVGFGQQINAVVFEGDKPVAVYQGRPGSNSVERPPWGVIVFTSGWNRCYFAQLENGMVFYDQGPSTGYYPTILTQRWTRTSYRLADRYALDWTTGAWILAGDQYFGGGEIVWHWK